MCKAEGAIEIASYALIALFGLRLVWVKGRTFIRALQAVQPVPAIAGVPHDRHDHDHHHHDAHDHSHDHAHAHHHHEHDHVHDEHCGHSHGPAPSELAGPGGWGRGFAAILTVGIRPCSGAILVLVFALAQGLFWAGIAATLLMGLGTAITVAAIAVVAVSAKDIAARLSAGRDGGGALFMRGIEFAAAGLVLLFGAGLLLGYIAAERTTCF
jgi:nickel/cobalt transporter (NicO) family protein